MLCVVAWGAFLRLYHLGSSTLWFDELASIELAIDDGGLTGVWQSIVEWGYPHPPLFIAILHLWFRVFGISEFTARIVPAFGGILAVPLLYRYIAESVGKKAALEGAFLLAFSPYHIFYSQEARPYTLSFSLAIVTWLVLRRALLKGGIKWWLAHTVCLVFLLYLHYFNVCAIAGEFVYVLIFWHRQRRRLWSFLLSGTTALLLFLPALPNVEAGTVVLNRTSVDISLLATLMTMVTGEARYVTDWVRATGFAVFALLSLLGLINLRQRSKVLVMNLLPLLSAFLFVFVALKAIGYVVPPYEDRQFMVVFPFLLAIAASGGEYLLDTRAFSEDTAAHSDSATVRPWLKSGRLVLLVLCVLIVLTVDVIALNRYYFHFVKNADIKVVEYIDALALPGDIVVCNSYSVATTLNYYRSDVSEYVAKPCRNNRDGSEYLIKPCRTHQDGWEFSEQLALFPGEEIHWTETLADVLGHPRIWLVYLEGNGPEELTQELLKKTTLISQQNIGPFMVWLLAPG